jgi:hypothetical protein
MVHRSNAMAALVAAAWMWMIPGAPAGAQQGGGGRGAGQPDPFAVDDHTGFESIFDGKTMKGWDGDPAFWRVENGALVGESTKEKRLTRNTFLIWRGGEPKDFELKAEYRLNATNSGIQYRSVELTDIGKWVMKGYQADIDFENRYTGQLYEERGRGFLALRGQMTHIEDGKKPRVTGSLQTADELKGLIKADDWNHYHIIARGNMLLHVLNGRVTAVVIDDDTTNRALGGLIGLQLHMGPPMKVEFRNIWLKKL